MRYACQRCTNCCRWPGFVRVTEEEIVAIAAFVGIAEDDFIQHHTRLRPNRAVKPQQCRDFPNGWNFPGWRNVCEALEISE